MILNKILTVLNASLKVAIYGLKNVDGSPQTRDTLEGLPIGTADQSSTGELAVKVIVISQRGTTTAQGGFIIPPYDKVAYTYFSGTNNIETATYSSSGTTVRTLTFAYEGGGSSDNDLVISITAS